MAQVLSKGTTATLTPSSGTAITLDAYSIQGASRVVAMANYKPVSAYVHKKIPGSLEPGTVTVELYLDDTATATNHYTIIKDWQAKLVTGVMTYTSVTLAINPPGSNIDTMFNNYQGYISDVGDPQWTGADEPLRFTVTIALTEV
jgi:hypothetical protein